MTAGPRTPREFVVYGFATTHRALDAEALLRDMGVQVVPVPTPKSLGALCGIALRVDPEEAERVEMLLLRAALDWSARATYEDV